MRKMPPKTHTYTILILLGILGVASGVMAAEYADVLGTSETVSEDISDNRNSGVRPKIPVSNTSSGNTIEQSSFNPQQSTSRLQPASGSRTYDTYNSQTTAVPPRETDG